MKYTQLGFFDAENKYERLTELGDPLEKLNDVINWEMFREKLTAVCQKENYTKGGRPPIDVIIKFKASILRRLYNLSFDQIEYQINDRLTFMRFLGLGISEKVLDSRTIWDFENTLAEAEVMEELFCMFDGMLEAEGLITHKGTIIDATFVDAPRQRNSRDENQKIKDGEIPEEWEKPENAPKLAQKDTDARWAKKGKEVHFGYKDHVKCDAESKLITNYGVTDAAVHDSQCCTDLLEESDKVFYADSAYSGGEIAENLPDGCENQICEKGTRNHPLTDEQKESNRLKSKVRCRIEHIFGFITNSMNGITIRSIGITRAWFQIGLTNLVYNICRYEFLKRPQKSRG
jgi:IS5 family transposase